MKKQMLIVILAAILVVLTSITAVVGTTVVRSKSEEKSSVSPLFTVSTQRYIKREDKEEITTNYLGKGRTLNLLFPRKTHQNDWVNKALKLVESRPNILNEILARLQKTPEVINLLEAHNIDINDLKKEITQIKNNPSLLKEKYEDAVQVLGEPLEIPLNYPIESLGFIDEWSPGILLLYIILLPAWFLVGMVIASILIITCVIPQCFIGTIYAVVVGVLQGLRQPDY